jgi:hypothetical protein
MIFDPEMFVYNLCDRSYHPFSLIIFISLEAYWRLPPRGYRSCTTLVLGLIAHRTLPALRLKNRYSIMKRLLEDGLILTTRTRLPFLIPNIRIHTSGLSAIFTVNAVLIIMIIAAPPGLKNITAR